MRRVLFVDDESHVREGLRRSLHGRRGSWEMTFADGGEAALAALAGASFDVIVSDMRMPGMDGATLLTRVREQHPSVVRIILSGFSELEASLRAVPVAHQFLTKPCTGETLVEVVERACGLAALLNGDAIRRIVGGMRALPSPPAMYQRITAALADPESSIRTLASIVERDVAMSAKILHIVNSSFFAVSRRFVDIKAAVSFLGTNMLRQLVLSVEAFRAWDGVRVPGFDLEASIRHAALTAHLARRLLPVKREAEDAFMAAMLHDIGRLVLAAELPEEFASMLAASVAESRPLEEIEEERLGVSHGHIGAYLLGLWGVPYAIVEAVANHDAPANIPQAGFGVLAAVHIADRLAHECTLAGGVAECEIQCPLDGAYLEQLGVADRLPEWRGLAQDLATTDQGNPG